MADTLRRLAASHGVATEYVDWQNVRRPVSDATLRAVLADLGTDAAQRPPAVVVRAGSETTVELPEGTPAELVAEDGERRALGPALDAGLTLPDLPIGYYHLEVPGAPRRLVLVAPERISLPAALTDRRQWGTATQLYAMPSARSWGMGDLDDLARLAEWSAREHGAGFVLVNPLHAGGICPPLEPSPYLPASRRFVDPLYLAIDALPEYAALDDARRAEVDAYAEQARQASTDRIERDAVWAAKRTALRILFEHAPIYAGALAAYRARRGTALADFAAWCALSETHGRSWREWPPELRDPRSPAVAESLDNDETDFWCWVQYACDAQLARTQERAVAAGMDLGVLHDLAVGVSPDGADAWCLGDVFAQSCRTGAPPDAFNQLGQDWGQHPWRPDRLAKVDYAPFREMVAEILRHAGGLRIDHVMGLFRLWWVPAGLAPTEGTYVHYDADAMLGILAIEAERAGAVIVGEDLGTVEPGVRTELAARGVLGTSILWFEQDWDAGAPLPPERWRRDCLASVTTHDLPPTAGYLAGAHIELRDRLGLLTEPRAAEEAKLSAELEAWRAHLTRLGFRFADDEGLIEALHAFLGRTPARLLCASVSDLAGDLRAPNQPGTRDEYPNWRLPLADASGARVRLEDLVTSRTGNRLAETMRSAARLAV